MALIEYAKTFLGIPYLWGGKSSQGFDCSGFIQEVLAFAGIDPDGDQNAQSYYNHFLIRGLSNAKTAGALVFYGKDNKSITHISMMINDSQIIEAGGGDHTTLTKEVAQAQRAFVRVRPVTRRKDIIAIILPLYPTWLKS